MKRRIHLLAGNKSLQQPNNVIFFDTETHFTLTPDKRQIHYLWFGWACYQRRDEGDSWRYPEWHRFETIDAFWSWVVAKTRDKTRLYLFSHNGGFDLPVVHAFTELPARGWKLTRAVVDCPPCICTWRQGDRTIRYVDTLNIWRMPLDKVGASIGIPKLPMPVPAASKTQWDVYGKRDVEVIRVALLKWWEFLRREDLGGFAPTLAGQALTAYRHRFMAHIILVDDNEEAAELSRAAYVGGRVECFRIGSYAGDFFYLDVNSMYPSVMATQQFPQRLLGVYGRPTESELATWLEERAVICECELETNSPIYPVIIEGRLCFPVGRFTATLAGPELALAMAHGHLKSASRAAVYLKAPLFELFVRYMYGQRMKAREAGDEIRQWLFKLMLNSLYGKFGQRGRLFEKYAESDPNEVEVWDERDADIGLDGFPVEWDLDDPRRVPENKKPPVYHYRKFGGMVQQWQNEGESRDSMPCIAAYVTAYARVVLWRAIVQAGRENCLYCDTDSLVVTREGFERLEGLIHPDHLGWWKLERELQVVQIYGPKDYVFDGEKKVKGVRHNATWISEDDVVQDHFVGFRGLLREGSLDSPIVYSVQKHLSRAYTKGTVSASGNVSPLRLGDG